MSLLYMATGQYMMSSGGLKLLLLLCVVGAGWGRGAVRARGGGLSGQALDKEALLAFKDGIHSDPTSMYTI